MPKKLPPANQDQSQSDAQLAHVAMLTMGALAAIFVTEPETWPVFLRYMDERTAGAASVLDRWRSREHAISLLGLARLEDELGGPH
jgi:hypothetical protein